MPVMPIEDGGTSTGSCECHPSAIKHCELKEIVCGGDNDCPSNFACTTIAVAGTSSCAATDGPDASTCEPASMIVTEEKRCMPRYFNDYGGKGTAAQAGSDSGGTVSTSGMGESKPAGTTPPTTPNAPDAGAADDDQTTDAEETATDPAADNAGCSVSHPGQQGSQHGYLAGLFLMALGLRARRRPR
jgi:MYXO-CTERM domain-containing protein